MPVVPQIRPLGGWMRMAAVAAILLVGTGTSRHAAFGDDTDVINFGAVAAADGMRVRVSSASLAVVPDIVDGGGPTAQAEVNSLGTSQGFASAPYPGETVRSLPGLIGVATGQSVPVSYPFAAASSHPTTPDGRVEQPGYTLSSHSDADLTTSSAELGRRDEEGNGSALASRAVAQRAAQVVTAEARTTVQAVAIGPVHIEGFTSESSVQRSASKANAERKASSSVAAFRVGDVVVGLTDHGVVLAGTTIPAETFAPVREALKQAGVTLRFVDAVQTDDGVIAPGLEISRPVDMPGGGQVLVTYTLGRAAAFATLGGVTATVPVGSEPMVGTIPTPGDSTVAPVVEGLPIPPADRSTAAPVGPASPLASGLDATGPSGVKLGAAGLPDGSATPPAAPALPTQQAGAGLALSSTPPPGATLSSWGLYPITVLAGAAFVAASQLRRILTAK